jgi:hypothetical protein
MRLLCRPRPVRPGDTVSDIVVCNRATCDLDCYGCRHVEQHERDDECVWVNPDYDSRFCFWTRHFVECVPYVEEDER